MLNQLQNIIHKTACKTFTRYHPKWWLSTRLFFWMPSIWIN